MYPNVLLEDYNWVLMTNIYNNSKNIISINSKEFYNLDIKKDKKLDKYDFIYELKYYKKEKTIL